MTFDTLGAMRKLRDRGAEEPLAEGIVEVVTDATGELVTREHFDERMVADREYLDARWVADREYYDARFAGEHQYFDAKFDARFQALRAELYRALAIQGGVILAGVGVIVAMVETLN